MSTTWIDQRQHDVLLTNYKYCAVSGSEITRKISVGTDWTKLCVAWMADFDLSGSVVVDSPGLYFGLCSSTGSLIEGTNPNWVGIKLLTAGDTLTMYSSYDTVYGSSGQYSHYVMISGSTEYSASATNISLAFAGYETTTQISPMAFAIVFEKYGNNQLSCSVLGGATGALRSPMQYPTFINGIFTEDIKAMETAWEAISSVAMTRVNPGSLNSKEEDYGYLDTVSIVMPNINQRLLLSAVAVKKWA